MRDLFRAVGNERFNELWEARATGQCRLAPASSRAAKEAWVRAKYCDAAYLAPLPACEDGTLRLEECLQLAAGNGNALQVLHCLGLRADVNAQCSTSGRTALHKAAVAGKLDCVELLLQNSAGCNVVDMDELTAMDCAMVASQNDVVTKLLKWCSTGLGSSRLR
eukprot:1696232-Amphidinium_carterae.1